MSPVPGDPRTQGFFDDDTQDAEETPAPQPEGGIPTWVTVLLCTFAGIFFCSMMVWLFTTAPTTEDYEKVASRAEQQLNELYVEDVDIYVTHDRGPGLMIVVDGEQTGCEVWNAQDMIDDPKLEADLRCLASEVWPFTPEPDPTAESTPKAPASPTPEPAPSETPAPNPIPTDPFADLTD